MRCQGPREAEAEYSFNFVITLLLERVQQTHQGQTDFSWLEFNFLDS